ncbi:MAG: hypothetical protein HY812_00220 [Planctomycetes bacterium]|nr:hypothetical protein [Planctomycetota bacterium]
MSRRAGVPTPPELARTAERLLRQDPDPVVRLRLLRDVLRLAPGDPLLVRARSAAASSRWVALLRRQQRPDGSFGRLHSAGTRSTGRVSTTETGVQRALALGLHPRHPVLERAAQHLAALLRGTARFPDPPEKNDRWATGSRLFAAATLALIRPDARTVREAAAPWREILKRTFASSRYDAGAEIRAHRELTGASVAGSYLTLDSAYHLRLIGARAADVPITLQRAWLRWLWERPGGIRYLSAPLPPRGALPGPGAWDRWLSSLELLTPFAAARPLLAPALSWLCAFQDAAGSWDLGAAPPRSTALPLSSTRWTATVRRQDWTARVLCLLVCYHLGRGT